MFKWGKVRKFGGLDADLVKVIPKEKHKESVYKFVVIKLVSTMILTRIMLVNLCSGPIGVQANITKFSTSAKP